MPNDMWRYVAMGAIVLILSMLGSISLMELWTESSRRGMEFQQRQTEALWGKVESLQQQIEQLGRADLSRGIETSQTKSRIERLEIAVRDIYKSYATWRGMPQDEPNGR